MAGGENQEKKYMYHVQHDCTQKCNKKWVGWVKSLHAILGKSGSTSCLILLLKFCSLS